VEHIIPTATAFKEFPAKKQVLPSKMLWNGPVSGIRIFPKRVFDKDESEDENVDNIWADFGYEKKPKIRREKIDYGEPIVNSVGNGGSIGVGPRYGSNSNSNSFGAESNSFKTAIGSTQSSKSYAAAAGGAVSHSFCSNGGAPSQNGGDQNPPQERIRLAYEDWCNHHGKRYDLKRLPTFQKHFLAMEKYCQETGTPLKELNEFADLSQEEYKRARPPAPPSPKKKSDTPDWILDTPESKIESKEEFWTFGPRWGKEPPPGAEALLNKEAIDPVTGAKRDFQGERRIRLAYQEWCNRNNKQFEESRLPAFTHNFVAMQQYCMTQ
jgi:hypothetical protein